MQISRDEKNIFIHFCIHMNYMAYELVHNVLLTIVVMTLLQCQGPEGTTGPDYPCPALPGLSLPCLQPRTQFQPPGDSPHPAHSPVSGHETPSDSALPQIQLL